MALVAGLLLVAGCADDPAEPLSLEPPPLVPAAALADHAVDDAVAKLDGLAEQLMADSGIPGMAVAVVHGGKTVYAKGFGVKNTIAGDADANEVHPDTVFQLASLSKPISASVVAHQVGGGAISWDTPVVDKLPWFALSDPVVTRMVTVGDLFAHRSGLPDHAGDQLEDLGYDRGQVLRRLRELPLTQFRTSYAYTNFGLTAAAEAVATSVGTPWEVLADETIFTPLGMTTASYRFADYAARDNRALGHVRVDGGYRPEFVRDADTQAPAGGVSASVEDVARWLAMILGNGTADGKQVVDPAALLPALTPQITSDRATQLDMRSGSYGYGFNVSTTSAARTQLSHSGAFELGAATNFLILPSADVAIVALTNATPTGVPETLTAQFADLVQFGRIREDWRELYRKAFAHLAEPVGSLVGRPPPVDPAPAGPLGRYLGDYANPYWGTAHITARDGALVLALGPKLSVPLRHWDGDVFTFALGGENAPPGSLSKAAFTDHTLVLEYFDDDGMGTFTR